MTHHSHDDDPAGRFYLEAALAFVRGRLGRPDLPADRMLEAAQDAGLRLTKFKRSRVLPRVARVLGMLRGLHPEAILDIGCGRGTFLWPLLDELPWLPVTACDVQPLRALDAGAVARGGVARLTAVCADVNVLPFPDDCFDVVTALEVVEHLPQPHGAVRELVRVARRAVIVSVPSRPDDNPEHLHVFDAASLGQLFHVAGAPAPRIEYVHNHMIVLAMK